MMLEHPLQNLGCWYLERGCFYGFPPSYTRERERDFPFNRERKKLWLILKKVWLWMSSQRSRNSRKRERIWRLISFFDGSHHKVEKEHFLPSADVPPLAIPLSPSKDPCHSCYGLPPSVWMIATCIEWSATERVWCYAQLKRVAMVGLLLLSE